MRSRVPSPARPRRGAPGPGRRLRPGAGLLCALALACGSSAPLEPIPGPGDYLRTLESGGLTRTYEVHVPTGVDPSVPTPLVLVFHGVPRGAGMRTITGFDAAAAAHGFVVAYARGSEFGLDWAVGCDLCTSAARNGVDDVRFARALIARMAREMAIDRERVYAVGFSQGALMTHLLGCRLEGLAAVASVAATMIEPVWTFCAPPDPRAALFVHGDADPEFPPEGQAGELVSSVSLDDTVDRWRTLNGCPGEPEEETLPDLADDGTRVVRAASEGCRMGGSVILYRVEGGGHTWPGAPVEFPASFGRRSDDLSATQAIGRFFADLP